MDSGGYKIIYDNQDYTIDETSEYCAVYYKHKQIASFKTKEDAFEYVSMKLFMKKLAR